MRAAALADRTREWRGPLHPLVDGPDRAVPLFRAPALVGTDYYGARALLRSMRHGAGPVVNRICGASPLCESIPSPPLHFCWPPHATAVGFTHGASPVLLQMWCHRHAPHIFKVMLREWTSSRRRSQRLRQPGSVRDPGCEATPGFPISRSLSLAQRPGWSLGSA